MAKLLVASVVVVASASEDHVLMQRIERGQPAKVGGHSGSFLEGLAAKARKGDVKIDEDTRGLLNSIKETLVTDLGEITGAHASDQTSLNDAAAAVNHCNAWKSHHHNTALGNAISTQGGNRNDHSQCRGEESTLATAADTAWNQMASNAANFQFDVKPSNTDPSGDPGGIIAGNVDLHSQWITAQIAKLNAHAAAMTGEQASYETAHSAYTLKDGVCTTDMNTFEASSCTTVDTVCSMCSTFDNCYTSTKAAYDATSVTVNGNAEHRKVEWESMQYMICLVDVLVSETASSDRATALDACTGAAHNTDALTINLPGHEDAVACVRSEAQESPCNAQFETTEYSALFGESSYTCVGCMGQCPMLTDLTIPDTIPVNVTLIAMDE